MNFQKISFLKSVEKVDALGVSDEIHEETNKQLAIRRSAKDLVKQVPCFTMEASLNFFFFINAGRLRIKFRRKMKVMKFLRKQSNS